MMTFGSMWLPELLPSSPASWMISSSTVARDMSAPVLLLGWAEALLLARSARAAFADFGDFGV
jgi:hypothetical protein